MTSLATLLRVRKYGSNQLPLLPGQLPLFGEGKFDLVWLTGAYIVKAGVYRMRARVIAGGGAPGEAGGSTSVAAIMSATGGAAPSGATGGAGGVGTGGDFRANGGAGGNNCGGGGAAGSPLGNGGAGGNGLNNGGIPYGGGGGAVGGKAGGSSVVSLAGGGASPFQVGNNNAAGHDLFGLSATNSNVDGVVDAPGMPIPFPYFAFAGGGGFPGGFPGRPGGLGGPGAGGGGGYDSGTGGAGGVGGGSGGGGSTTQGGGRVHAFDETFPPLTVSSSYFPTNRLPRFLGGGTGGCLVSGTFQGGGGGGGYAHGEFNVTPGQSIALTVAVQGTRSSGGLIILEY